jgi:hypothetical protein
VALHLGLTGILDMQSNGYLHLGMMAHQAHVVHHREVTDLHQGLKMLKGIGDLQMQMEHLQDLGHGRNKIIWETVVLE